VPTRLAAPDSPSRIHPRQPRIYQIPRLARARAAYAAVARDARGLAALPRGGQRQARDPVARAKSASAKAARGWNARPMVALIAGRPRWMHVRFPGVQAPG